MSAATGPNYSIDNQISFIVQWFRTWSELQKDDFVEILAHKLGPGGNMNGLVNGMQNLDTGSRRVSLFSCQMKLFNEWWGTWPEADKNNLTSRLKESDPKFWATVQEELSGTRKRLEDDFFLTINCVPTNGIVNTTTNGQSVGAETVSEVEITNGVHDPEEEVEEEVKEVEEDEPIYENGITITNGEADTDMEAEGDGPSG